MSTQADDDVLQVKTYPAGSRFIGPGDDVVISAAKLNAYITATCEQVISDDEQYQEIAYPKTDNEGEVLWSKNAIRESRKQRMQRVVDRNDLRAEQRRTLARLTGGTK